MKKRKIFIICAGGFGREVEDMLFSVNECKHEIAGYINDFPDSLSRKPSRLKILGSIDDFKFPKDSLALLAITNCDDKYSIFESLKDRVEFYTFIHPSSRISPNAQIGRGCIISENCLVNTNVKLGDFVTLNMGCQIGHDASIGDFSSLMPSVDVGGNALIGAKVFSGTKSVVAPRIEVCDKVKISLGAVLTRNIAKPCTVFGNPAKFLL